MDNTKCDNLNIAYIRCMIKTDFSYKKFDKIYFILKKHKYWGILELSRRNKKKFKISLFCKLLLLYVSWSKLKTFGTFKTNFQTFFKTIVFVHQMLLHWCTAAYKDILYSTYSIFNRDRLQGEPLPSIPEIAVKKKAVCTDNIPTGRASAGTCAPTKAKTTNIEICDLASAETRKIGSVRFLFPKAKGQEK